MTYSHHMMLDARIGMTTEQNPIEASKDWLIECGYTETEAKNLLRAIHHEKSALCLFEQV